MKPPWTWLYEKLATSTLTQLINTWADEDGPEFASGTAAQLGLRAYRSIALIHACVRILAESAASPDYQIWTGSGDSAKRLPDTDPMLQLLEHGEQGEGSFQQLEMIVTHLYLTGTAYLHKVRAVRSNQVVHLRVLRPDRTRPDPQEGQPLTYTYTVGGIVRARIPEEDIIVFKLPHPSDDFEGLSPVEVAAKVADLDARGMEFLRAFFLNRGVPAGLLKLQGRVDPIERRRIKEQWLEEYSGFRGWQRLAVLDGGADYQQLALGLQNMHLDGIFDQTETRMAMCFGVPLILLGSRLGMARSTLANYDSAMKHLWTITLQPLYIRLGDQLTVGLADEFPGVPRWVLFDLSKVAALQESMKDLRTFALGAWDSGLMTRNRALALAGQDPEPDGDVYKLSTAVVLVPAGQTVVMPKPQDEEAPVDDDEPADEDEDEDEDEDTEDEAASLVVIGEILVDKTSIQSLLFDGSKFTVAQAKKWCRSHGFKASKVDTTEEDSAEQPELSGCSTGSSAQVTARMSNGHINGRVIAS